MQATIFILNIFYLVTHNVAIFQMVSLYKDPHGENVLRPETTLHSVNKMSVVGVANNGNSRLSTGSLSEDSTDTFTS